MPFVVYDAIDLVADAMQRSTSFITHAGMEGQRGRHLQVARDLPAQFIAIQNNPRHHSCYPARENESDDDVPNPGDAANVRAAVYVLASSMVQLGSVQKRSRDVTSRYTERLRQVVKQTRKDISLRIAVGTVGL